MEIKMVWEDPKKLEAYLCDLENMGQTWWENKMRLADCRQIQNAFGPLEDLLEKLKKQAKKGA